MLDLRLQLHRGSLLAHTERQKLFVLLTLQPTAQARQTRAPLQVVFVVDTSGSMREVVTEHTQKHKMDLVIEALQGVFQSNLLRPEDRLALVKFDDQAQVLLPATPASQQARLLAAAERLDWHSGGTHIGAGLQQARTLLEQATGQPSVVLLTDGQTSDEALVRDEARLLAARQVPVTSIGVGDEVNTGLLLDLTNQTQGQAFDVVPDNQHPQPPAVRASELPRVMLESLQNRVQEVVSNVQLSVRTIRDVTLDRVTRVHPVQTEVSLLQTPFALGNIAGGTGARFVLEFTLPARPPARMRIAQLGLTYQVPGARFQGELPPQDLVVELVHQEAETTRLDPEVMRFVQQRNLEGLVLQAMEQASSDPQQAASTLQLARTLTENLKNPTMTRVLDRALQEIKDGQQVSRATQKTLQIGAKTQTLSSQDVPLSDEEIRKISGA